MYKLPKICKKNTAFCPIFSMTGSTQHELATYLSFILQPALDLHSTNCIKESFTSAKTIHDLNSKATFLCSFEIKNLFINVPLDETINICAKVPYNSNLISPSFSNNKFCQLMYSVTISENIQL